MRHKRILSILIAALAFICLNPQTAMADESKTTAEAYRHKYTQNGALKFKSELPGVYFAAVTKGEKADTATLGIPSLAKQNLESAPTTESPAIIQGAAVPFEKRAAVSSRIEFERISDEEICAPYSRFRYQITEEANANGNGTHQKISGFDGTYVIVRLDVSDLIREAPEGSYLHVKTGPNKAMLTATGLEERRTDTGETVSGVTFTDNTGTRVACYALADDAAALKDGKGLTPDTPFVDIIMMSSGALVAGAEKGAANAPGADFPISFYVDQTKDYDPSIEWDTETNSVINSETREVIADQTDAQGTVIKTAQAMLLDKYYDGSVKRYDARIASLLRSSRNPKTYRAS